MNSFGQQTDTEALAKELAISEAWLPVVGYEGCYEVSDLGRIRALRVKGSSRLRSEPLLLKQALCKRNGYFYFGPSKDGRQTTAYVHVVVLKAFAGPRPDGYEACHGDGNRQNNRRANLRWDTGAANKADRNAHGKTVQGVDHFAAKFTEDDIRRIRACPTGYGTGVALAAEFGAHGATISKIRKRTTWKHV